MEVGKIEAQVSTQTVDLLRYVWIIPIIVGFVTFILTTIVNHRKDKKQFKMEKMAFLKYEQSVLDFPFNDRDCTILCSREISRYIDSLNGNKTKMAFLVLENVTENNVLDLKIEVVSSDDKKSMIQEFNLPMWKSSEILYIPVSIPGSTSYHVTDEKLNVYYTTLGFEKYVVGYKRKKPDVYDEYLKKIYFRFIKYTKIKYKQSDFYKYIKVEKVKQTETEKETEKSPV